MVTAISLARRRRDGLSPGSPSDSISYSTGQLRVRTKLTLREQGSFSRSQSSLFIWSLAVPSSLIVSIFRLYTFTSYRLLSKDWGLFQILVLPSRCRGVRTPDLITIPLPAHTAGWNNKYIWAPLSDDTADWDFLIIYPIINLLRKMGHCERPWISFKIICLCR